MKTLEEAPRIFSVGRGLKPLEKTDLPNGTRLKMVGYSEPVGIITERIGDQYSVLVTETDGSKPRIQRMETFSIRPWEEKFGIGWYIHPDGGTVEKSEYVPLLQEAQRLADVHAEKRKKAEQETADKKARGAEWLAANKPSWAQSAILGYQEIDDCDSMTDYFNTKTKRVVLLAWSKHKRNLFPELRKAAANFSETAHLAESGKEAEHRENYSMGAGTYLKASGRYNSGWKVQKDSWMHNLESVCGDPENIHLATKPEPRKKSTGTATASPDGVTWEPIQTTHHAKKDIPLWVCVLADRVDRDCFVTLRDRAKSFGGWYSRYNGQGAIPGFQFTSESDALAFIGGGDSGAVEKSGNAGLADRLDEFADKLESEVEAKRAPMTQNPTPKRLREHGSRLCDACHLERGAQAMRALAALHRAGDVPQELAGYRTKKAILEAVRTRLDSTGGYYDPPRDTGEFSDDSETAKALQSLVSGESEADKLKRDIERREREVLLGSIPGYFPTPEPVISRMLELAGDLSGQRILEPSAGNGNIVDALPDDVGEVVPVEYNNTLATILIDKGYSQIRQRDFLEVADELGRFDAVLMNPPFERGQDFRHIEKAASLLNPGGVLVGIYAAGANAEKVEAIADYWEELPAGSFKASGTGVSARVCVIHA